MLRRNFWFCSIDDPSAFGALEAIIPGCLSGFTDDDIALLTDMSRAADRPLNWNVLGVSAGNPDGHEKQLRASQVAAERGGRIVALTLPHSTSSRLPNHPSAGTRR